jgi:hypothetical protein
MDVGKWSASRSDRFTAGKEPPDRRLGGVRTGLDTVEKKSFAPAWHLYWVPEDLMSLDSTVGLATG